MNELELIARIEQLESKIKDLGTAILDLDKKVGEKFKRDISLIHHGFTRVETLVRCLTSEGIVSGEQFDKAYDDLVEFRKNVDRINSPALPMKEKVEEMLKWNTDKKRIQMGPDIIRLPEYLMENPDKLDAMELKSMAKRAGLGQDFANQVEVVENQRSGREGKPITFKGGKP